MSSGFSIGLNALQANAGAIEVASKNIAASNVSGFKSTEYLFQESLSRAMQPSVEADLGRRELVVLLGVVTTLARLSIQPLH